MLHFINGRDLIKGHNSQKIIISKNFRHTTILFSSNEPKFPEKIRNWDFLVVCTFPSCMYIVHLHIVSHMCISYFFQILLRTLFDTGQSSFKSTKIHRQIMESKSPGNVQSTHCALNTYKVSQNSVLHLKKSCADKKNPKSNVLTDSRCNEE